MTTVVTCLWFVDVIFVGCLFLRIVAKRTFGITFSRWPRAIGTFAL